jgi:hypothetical protein
MEIQTSDLARILQEGNNNDLVAKIKEVIPEYKSNNSVFEKLDKQVYQIKKGLNS